VLAAAAVLPRGSEVSEKEICSASTPEQAIVRAAAYRALASRDPQLWTCTGLVAGSELDPDPEVQAVTAKRR